MRACPLRVLKATLAKALPEGDAHACLVTPGLVKPPFVRRTKTPSLGCQGSSPPTDNADDFHSATLVIFSDLRRMDVVVAQGVDGESLLPHSAGASRVAGAFPSHRHRRLFSRGAYRIILEISRSLSSVSPVCCGVVRKRTSTAQHSPELPRLTMSKVSCCWAASMPLLLIPKAYFEELPSSCRTPKPIRRVRMDGLGAETCFARFRLGNSWNNPRVSTSKMCLFATTKESMVRLLPVMSGTSPSWPA